MIDNIEFDLYGDKKLESREMSRLGGNKCSWTAAAVVVSSAIASNQKVQAAKGIANEQARAAERAAAVESETSERAVEERRRQFDITQAQQEPFRQAELENLQRGAPLREQRAEAAQQAFAQQRALTGLSGVEAQQQAVAGLQESPAQQFIRGRQEQALLRREAALGGLGGGQVRTALQEQAAGFASQDLQSQLARLSAFGQTGQVTPQVAQNLAGQRGQFAQGVSPLIQAGGQAQAAGLLGAAQARASGIRDVVEAQAPLIKTLGGGVVGGALGAQTGGVGFQQGATAGLLGKL